MNLLPNKEYQQILNGLKEKIRLARYRSALKVNHELLSVYWEIGNTILHQQKQSGWGSKIIDKLTADLKTEFPDFRGLSVRNLKYMRAFAEAYPDFLIVQGELAQLQPNPINSFVQGTLAQLNWYHHITLLDKVKDLDQRFFYMQKAVENGWTRDVMVLQIDNKLHERQGKAITNFSATLPAVYSDFAAATLKNPYIIDFLSLTEEMKERDIENGLILHMKKFMLELGRGFAYVGNQKNLNVDGDDFFLDLLFFNYNLDCFVIFELKVGAFKPEYAGKLNFYVNTVNEQIKLPQHKPTIGVLLCKTPNKTVIEYSLKGIESPIGVAEYELMNALPKALIGEIPTVEELEAEIEKEYEELKSPSEKRFDNLKEKLSKIKKEEIKTAATKEILEDVIDKSLVPLFEKLIGKMKIFEELFVTTKYVWSGRNSFSDISKLATEWKKECEPNNISDHIFSYTLSGLKKGGDESIYASFQLTFKNDIFWYGFTLANYNNHQPFVKKVYLEQLTENDIEKIVDTAYNEVIDHINEQVDRMNRRNNE